MRLPKLLRSVAFRLAALYALIFAVSVTVFAVVAYVAISTAMEEKIRARVRIEAQDLAGQYASDGLDRLVTLVKARERSLSGGFDYSIIGNDGETVYGIIPWQTLEPGWAEFKRAPDGDEAPGDLERFVVLTTPLPGGGWLLVGDDLNPVDDLGRTVRSGLALTIAMIFALSIAGGAVLSHAFLRRVDAITKTAEAIIRGDVRSRVPLAGTGDDLDRLSEALNRMLDRISSLIEALRQVTNDVAHDLRTPLGRLRQGLEDSRRRSLTPSDYAATIDRAIGETDSILDTFSALLRIAQLESGTRRREFRPTDLAQVVDDVCQAFAPSIEESGRSLRHSADPDCRIDGDKDLLAQMLVNLIENAGQHTPAGTEINVIVRRSLDHVVLEVADSGLGVPDAERRRIFDRFYRLERSRGTPGNGLGLSIVSAIADLHRAEIRTVDNRPGLRVVFTFPASRSVPGTDASVPGQAA